MKNRLLLLLALTLIGLNQAQGQCSAPIINSFSPNTGFLGSTVTITGANFDPIPANNMVYFGACKATVQTSSFGQMTVTVPVGATTALISVTNTNACGLTGYSRTPFNGIFCPTPLTATTYNNTAVNLTGVNGAYNLLVQDLDLDGKADIVSAYNNVTVARNTSTPGSLSFTTTNHSTVGGYASFVSSADFDGDGKRDLFTTQSFFRNTSSGAGNINFAVTGSGYSGYQNNVGDFNNDGKVDVVWENASTTMRVERNTSTGAGVISFANAATFGVGFRCTGIQAVDLDGDGKTDIIATQGDGNRMITLRNTTTAGATVFTFEAAEIWASGGLYPYRCQMADFDKDGKIDIATVNYNSGSETVNTAVFRNTSTPGDISFSAVTTYAGPVNNYRIAVGDVDGDGLPDIITKSLAVQNWAVYKNTSSGPGNISFASRIYYTSAAAAEVSGLAVGDLDGDFVPDVVTSGISSNAIRVHRNTSAQVDNTNPTAICKNITVALSPSGSVTVTPAMIDNGSSDACGLAPLLINGQSSVTYTCSNIGPNTATLTVTDLGANTATCTSTVNVAAAAIIVAGQTTVCQGQSVPMSANVGDTYQWYKDNVAITGATSQTYTATASGSYTVAVTNSGGCSGTSAPTVVTVNNNPTVSTTPTGTVFLCPPTNSALLSASLSSLYQWKLNGNAISGATQQTYTATAAGTYTVQVIDLFGCSATSDPINVPATAAEVDVTGNAISIVDGDNSPSLVDGTNFGTTFPSVPVVKTFVIHNTGGYDLTVSNVGIGGTNAANFTLGGITLPATIAPSSSASFTVTFNGTAIATYDATVTITDNDCDEGVYDYAIQAEISCVPAVFTLCPPNTPVNNDPGTCDAAVSYDATATGVPAPSVSYSFSGATSGSGSGTGSGATFNKGVTTVTITASNGCGPDATCSFDVTVSDDTPPAIACPGTANVDCLGSQEPTVTGRATATDNCTPSSNINITYSDGPPTAGNCAGNYFFIRTWTATDGANNSSSCPQTINVTDQTGPAIVCPADVTIACTQSTEPTSTGSATATDNCSGILSITYDDARTVGGCAGTYTIARTWTAKDNCDNTSTCVQTITVQDLVAPVITCAADVVQCDNQAGNTRTLSISATDNCGTMSTTWSSSGATITSGSGNSLTESFNVGTSTVVWVVKDDCNNTSTCTTMVLIRELPVASISVSTPDAFCNAVYLTGSSSHTGATDYAWTYPGATPYAASQAIHLGVGAGDGVYSLKVTDVNGCTSNAATYTFQKASLASSYSIIGTREVKLHQNNYVLNASVGATASNGKIKIDKYSTVSSAGAFVKGYDLDIDNQAVVPIRISSPAVVALPAMLTPSTASTSSLSNYTITTNGTYNSNYKDLTVNDNLIVTLGGNLFKKIKIKKGATVTFTASDMTMESLEIEKDATIHYSGNTNVRVSDKVSIKKGGNINPLAKKVTFYVTDPATSNDNEKFEIEAGDGTAVIANVYMPAGKLHVHGGGNEGGTLTGIFIAEKVESSSKYITWNSYNCGVSAMKFIPGAAPAPSSGPAYGVLLYPNPTNGEFTIQFEQTKEAAEVRITDIQGRLIEQHHVETTCMPSVSYNLSGKSAGVYMVEVRQGSLQKWIRLVVQ